MRLVWRARHGCRDLELGFRRERNALSRQVQVTATVIQARHDSAQGFTCCLRFLCQQYAPRLERRTSRCHPRRGRAAACGRSSITRDVRHRRDSDSPRGKLHCNAYVSLQSGRAGRKAHHSRPAKATGRLARRAQQGPAPGRPARVRRHRAASRPSRRPAPTEGRTGPRARTRGPTAPGHRPTNPAIAGPVVQHRPAQ